MADDIIEELHRVRENYAQTFNFDIDLMFADLRKKQAERNQKVVSFAANRVAKLDLPIDKKAA